VPRINELKTHTLVANKTKSKGCMLCDIFWSFLYKFIFIYYYSSYAATAFNSLWLIHMEFCMPRVASKIIFHFLLQPHFILVYRGYFLEKDTSKNVASTSILTLGLSHPKRTEFHKRQPTVYCQLPTVNCILSTAYCQLLSFNCSMLTATVYCLMLTVNW
jgi:hypothetical protein